MALTEAQKNKRKDFIALCVDMNFSLPYSARLGQQSLMTVQDLCAATTTTLVNVGKQLEKMQKNSEGSRFDKEGLAKVNGVEIESCLEFIELTIIKKDEDAKIADLSKEKADIAKQLENLKTPKEKRKELEARMAELSAV